MPRMRLSLVMSNGLRIKTPLGILRRFVNFFHFPLRLITILLFDSLKFAGIRYGFAYWEWNHCLANHLTYSMRISANSDMVSPSSLNLNMAFHAGATSLRYRFSVRRPRQMLNKIKVLHL